MLLKTNLYQQISTLKIYNFMEIRLYINLNKCQDFTNNFELAVNQCPLG